MSAGPTLNIDSDDDDDVFHDVRFPPDEEAALLKNSNDTKFQANKLFAQAQYSEAISSYDRALASCPNYLEYNIALLRSNIAACHLKLEDWKSAVESATAALDGLDREYPQWSGTIKKRKADQKEREMKEKLENSGDEQSSLLNAKNPIQAVAQVDEQVVEITDETEGGEQRTLEELQKADELRNDVLRIRAKALLRRARARSELDGWANLQGAIEDYTELKELDNLPRSDMKTVEMGLRTLPPRVTAARDKEMGEMMGKLKDLGNGLLKPFGLSTNMFKMVKDENTGGYSMSFDGNANE